MLWCILYFNLFAIYIEIACVNNVFKEHIQDIASHVIQLCSVIAMYVTSLLHVWCGAKETWLVITAMPQTKKITGGS